MRSAIAPLLLCIPVVVAAGVVHGLQTDRWGASAQLEKALACLHRLPPTVGDWRGKDVPYDDEGLARAAGIRGAVFRNFQNAHTRESVSTLVVCGRGGPISVHTPDVCYTGAGYRQLGNAQSREVEAMDRRHTFQVAHFAKPDAGADRLEIYWAWSRDGRSWEAPRNPRAAFARSPALFKLYVVRHYVSGSRDENAEACQSFLRRVLPEYGAALGPAD